MSDYLNYSDGQTQTDAPVADPYGVMGGYEPEPTSYYDQGQPMDNPQMHSMEAQDMAPNLTVQPPYLEEVQPSPVVLGGTRSDLSELVLDVEVPVEVFFGKAALTVEEFLELNRGAVLELDQPIDAAIELRVRGKVVAEGQLVTINGNYGLRVTRMYEEQK